MSSAPVLFEAVADWTFGIGVVVVVVVVVALLLDAESLLLLLRGFRLVTEAMGCALVSVFLLLFDVTLLLDVVLVVQQDDALSLFESLFDDLLVQQEDASFVSFAHELVIDVWLVVFVDAVSDVAVFVVVVFDEGVVFVVFVDEGVVFVVVPNGDMVVKLFVKASKLAMGENIRKVFSNMDMFCLLISSSVVPKGKMLPKVVWK